MSGNHNRSAHRRLLLLAFAVVCGWVVLHSWRPCQEDSERVLSAGQYLSARRSMTDRLGELADWSDYRWKSRERSTNGSTALTTATTTELPALRPPAVATAQRQPVSIDRRSPVSVTEPSVNDELPHAPQFSQLTDDDLLLSFRIPHERRQSFLDRVEPMARINYFTGHYSVDWWRRAGRTVALFGQRISPFDRHLAATPYSPMMRYASPPSLLASPLISRGGDRLAVIPGNFPAPTASTRHWADEAFFAARPYLANSLDRRVRSTLFVEPTALVTMLIELSHEPECSLWAAESLRTLGELASDLPSTNISPTVSLERLAYLSQQAEELAAETVDSGLATRLHRARYAMWRRIECWHAAYALVAPPVDRLTLAAGEREPSPVHAHRIAVATSSPPPVEELLALVEDFEANERPKTADQIAMHLAQLASSPDARKRVLGDSISTHYRNANARIAISMDLINRLLPNPAPTTHPVRDRVLGTPVKGSATSTVEPHIELLVDPAAWRMGLEVNGEVNSSTIALERTVRVRTTGVTRFAARQQIVIDHTGMHRGRVVAKANSSTRFQGARSQFDPLPLVGSFVRSKAASTFANRRSRAEREVSDKTARRVELQMAEQVEIATAKLERELRSQWLEPLAARGVHVEPIELATTADRLVGRVRIAHEDRLTAHTPRPRAPSDSLASLQLHESGLSYLAAGLQLEGQRLTAQQLAERLAEAFPNRSPRALDDDAKSTTIQFADRDAVTFTFADGKAQLTLAIRELVVRNGSHRNFKVHTYYKPQTEGLTAVFVHEDGPFLEGRLRNGDRMRLQTVFGKVFPEDNVIPFGAKYEGDPRLAGLMITQLVIDDGWLAAAIGPKQTERTAQLDRYAPLY